MPARACVCVCVCLRACVSLSLFLCLCVPLSLCLCQSVSVCVCLFVSVSICLSLTLCLSVSASLSLFLSLQSLIHSLSAEEDKEVQEAKERWKRQEKEEDSFPSDLPPLKFLHTGTRGLSLQAHVIVTDLPCDSRLRVTKLNPLSSLGF